MTTLAEVKVITFLSLHRASLSKSSIILITALKKDSTKATKEKTEGGFGSEWLRVSAFHVSPAADGNLYFVHLSWLHCIQ